RRLTELSSSSFLLTFFLQTLSDFRSNRYAIEVVPKFRTKFKKSFHNCEEGEDTFAEVGIIELKVPLPFDRALHDDQES
ncbi:MAG TPA: hypothetical protein VIE89_34970, partial [Candidatus Binatia bacterium]